MTKPKTVDIEQRRIAMLKQLNKAANELRMAEQRVTDAVSMVRAKDLDGFCAASWEDIGHALGTTKQGAQQRYGWRLK